jgi:hypothetical protein
MEKERNNRMNTLILQFKKITPLCFIVFALGCVTFLPETQAVEPRAPDIALAGGNTADGQGALQGLTTGEFNSAFGIFSLLSNGAADFNTGVGAGALISNTANENTATGAGALLSNTTGSGNAADGAFALFSNSTGNNNTAIGDRALMTNTTGFENTAVGSFALNANTDGTGHTAVGNNALASLTTGSNAFSANTAVGSGALSVDTFGNGNTAVGYNALGDNRTGDHNTALGNKAGLAQTTGNGNVYIGAGVVGVAGESNNTYIANINTTNVSGAGTDTVTVNLTTGLLGHLTSSRRYKEEIKPMNSASEALYRLKPVTYRYKKEIDRTQSPAFGLIAEDVAEVNPNLVACNSHGEPEGVHYEMVDAMLLNEFLKEHKTVQEQGATIACLQKQIEVLTAGLQKMSVRLEAKKPASQLAENNQ